MILLALETSTFAGGVALMEDERPLVIVEHGTRLDHSRKILDSIDFALQKASLKIDDIEAIAVSTGPGSFTGVRIGLTHAKTLSWQQSIPIVGIPSVNGLAARHAGSNDYICAMVAARRGEVFAALYNPLGDSLKLNEIIPLHCSPVIDVLNKIEVTLKPASDQRVRFCGNGAERHESEIIECLGEFAFIAPVWLRMPSPIAIGLLGLERLRSNDIDKAESLEPIYVRHESNEFKEAPPQIEI
jgi:tRNA threonylcarbamoyladenosine biosynthesis protein TsaB